MVVQREMTLLSLMFTLIVSPSGVAYQATDIPPRHLISVSEVADQLETRERPHRGDKEVTTLVEGDDSSAVNLRLSFATTNNGDSNRSPFNLLTSEGQHQEGMKEPVQGQVSHHIVMAELYLASIRPGNDGGLDACHNNIEAHYSITGWRAGPHHHGLIFIALGLIHIAGGSIGRAASN